MSATALVIIDMQVGNFSESDPIWKGTELLLKIKNLINKARSAHIPIVFVQNMGGTGDPDEYGTPGWAIHPSLAPIEGDIVVQKQTPDSFHATTLHRQLGSKGIKKLIIGGLQTEYCIDTTCRRAVSLGYDVILVEDAHSTWNSPHFTAQQIIEHHNHVLGSWFTTMKKESDIAF
ncbi:MAG: cysteine hydrolase family protein [Candidatus Heimdallarchaeota archaeon]